MTKERKLKITLKIICKIPTITILKKKERYKNNIRMNYYWLFNIWSTTGSPCMEINQFNHRQPIHCKDNQWGTVFIFIDFLLGNEFTD